VLVRTQWWELEDPPRPGAVPSSDETSERCLSAFIASDPIPGPRLHRAGNGPWLAISAADRDHSQRGNGCAAATTAAVGRDELVAAHIWDL